MLPIERLTVEHRLIDQMLRAMARELERMTCSCSVRPDFIDAAVQFLQTYADLMHHGKEEEILFRALEAKPMTEELRRTMGELQDEHQHVRERTTLLVAARQLCHRGSGDACTKVADVLGELLTFYADHVRKEERHFFVPSMSYFSDEEKAAMLAEMDHFDQKVLHQKYRRLVEHLENDD
jgi:hemerythrin-like domain-containing protein